MPFINKVTVKGQTYYLENLVANNGSYIVSLPTITGNDKFVTESTITNFTVSRNEMPAQDVRREKEQLRNSFCRRSDNGAVQAVQYNSIRTSHA